MFTSPRYSLAARLIHWAVAVCVLILFPLGLWATWRAGANLWDDLTNTLYAWHKTIGFAVLILMVLRLVIRLGGTLPPNPPYLAAWEINAARATHLLLYLLLFLVPLLGWAGITAYPALEVLAGMRLPAMPFIAKGEALARFLFDWHANIAIVLGAVLILHVAAALRHRFIKRDGIMDRMWFGSN